MEASQYNVVQRIFGNTQMILRIPVYQRNYDWNERNVKQLLSDLKEILRTSKQHFIGAIVYMVSQNNDAGMQDFLVIDGQQRLTTITLLFAALRDLCDQNDQQSLGILNAYLTNQYTSEEKYKIKLKPIKSDNVQYTALLNKNKNRIDENSHIYQNYAIAKNEFKKWLDEGYQINEIINALNRLQVVGISLTQGIDDPQTIFASLNSTGLALTNSDLIRNYLLMSDSNQEELFEDYWLPIEEDLRRGNDNRNMDAFFRQFMIMKYSSPISERKVYDAFISFCQKEHLTHKTALQELNDYVRIYNSFLHPEESDYNEQVKASLSDLKRISQTTCYPFLLRVFNDYKNDVIDEDTLTKVVHLITVYLIRRLVCDVPSNSLLGFFANFYSRTFRISKNKEKYYEVINKYLFSQQNRNEVPDDEKLEYALKHKRMYQDKNLCNLLMLDIENGDCKEKLNTSELTIEHIMPQTMSRVWRQHISDEDHDQYVHTLGNLSVTGYNSEMSNKSFDEKKKILEQNSKAVVLNKDVVDKDQWTIKDIKERADRLSKILMSKYSMTKVEDPDIVFELVDTISLDKSKEAKGRKPVSFTLEGSDYPVKSYKEITLKVLQILDQDDPDRLEKLVGLTWKGTFEDSNANNNLIICHKDDIAKKGEWHYGLVKDGIYVMVGGSSDNIMHVIKQLLDAYGIDEDNFSVSVRAEEE